MFESVNSYYRALPAREKPDYSKTLAHIFKLREVLPPNGVVLVVGPGANQWEWLLPLLARPDCKILIAGTNEIPAIQYLLSDGKQGSLKSIDTYMYGSFLPGVNIRRSEEPLREVWNQVARLGPVPSYAEFKKLLQTQVFAFHDVSKRQFTPKLATTDKVDPLQALDPTRTQPVFDFDVHPYLVKTPIPKADVIVCINPIRYGTRDIAPHAKPGTTVITSSFDGRHVLPLQDQPLIRMDDNYAETHQRDFIDVRLRNGDTRRVNKGYYVWKFE